MSEYPKRIEVLGAPLDPFTMEQTIDRACDLIEEGSFAHLIGINADKLLQMKDDAAMDAIVRKCEIINADGASMVMAARRLGKPVPERVAGIDLMMKLCAVATERGYRVYLLGAKRAVVEKTKSELMALYSGISIVGIHDGYFSEEDYFAIANTLKDTNPQITFIGITSPKKEHLVEYFRKEGLPGVYVGVGGSFDVVSGNVKRAPEWVQDIKMEWLYRMMQEPKRLARRYAVGNIRFMRLLRESLKNQSGE